jgi:hypothetical protein
VKVYSEAEMNEAIRQVETGKQNHPIGFAFLDTLGLSPSDRYVRYSFANADAHMAILSRHQQDDLRVVYSAGWLNGLAIGAALGAGRP